jgi:hypothetical protein
MSVKNIGELFDLRGRNSHGRTGILPTDGVMMTVGSAGKGRKCLAIGIGAGLMKVVRWVTGDRVTVDLDPAESTLTLRRVVPTNGTVSWKLSNRNGGKCFDGKVASATLKITATPMMLTAFGLDDATDRYIPNEVITSETGITFPMRKPWTVVHR